MACYLDDNAIDIAKMIKLLSLLSQGDLFVKCLKQLNIAGITMPAGALVLWLWEETHIPKVVGSNPGTLYWMDILSHISVVKIVLFVWKRPKMSKKEAGVGPFKKTMHQIFLQKFVCCAHQHEDLGNLSIPILGNFSDSGSPQSSLVI